MSIHFSQFSVTVWAPVTPPPPPPPPVVPPTAGAFRFDSGEQRVDWYLVAQITDSGDELRSKTVKAFRATGKMTLPEFIIYGYQPQEGINVSDVENGINGKTRAIPMPTTELVTQSARTQINVANVVLWTWRLQGTWDGQVDLVKDRIDETVCEVAQQGVRR